jgi:hypothetical protein
VKKSRSILTVQDSKLERLRVVAKNENPIVSEIREYVTWRLEQERSYKGKMCEELKAGRWKTSGFSSQKTALESASGLMEIIGAIGLHYHSIGDEWRKTIKALQKYVEKLQRKGRTKEKKTAGRN